MANRQNRPNRNNNKKNNPKTPTYYLLIILLIVLVFNLIFGPGAEDVRVEEITYSEFIDLIEQDRVEKVQADANQYKIQALDENGNSAIYKTGPWNNTEALTQLLEEKNVEYGAVIPSSPNPILYILLSFVLPFGLLFLLGRMLMKNVGNSGAMKFGKSNAKVYVKADKRKTFDDVAGQDEAKESLTEIVDFLSRPQKYTEIGAVCPKGVLLIGPPGTGKTLLAQAVAGEADVPFFSISGSEFVELFVGMGASKVRDLFSEAKKQAPCIVFIDEIDAIGKKRDSSGIGGNDEREQTLNQLLSEMDGFEGNSGVVILAATNRPEILDPALTRPGRFDRQVRVELPDIKGREDILKVHAKDVKMDPNVNLKNIAKMTAGASGADLANIINEGALRAVRMDRSVVIEEDLVESVEVVIAGQQKKNSVITDRDKTMIAYHEVGHALVAALQKHSAPVTKITIIPRTSGALGYTMQVEEEEKVLMTVSDIFQQIVTLAGGRSSEEIVFKTKTTGASNDIERATKLARSMVTRFGMTDEFDFIALETSNNQYLGGDSQLQAAPGTAKTIDDKVREIISKAHETALEILRTHEQQLHDIAAYLLEKETITGEEFMEVLNRSLEFYGMDSLKEMAEEERKDKEDLKDRLENRADYSKDSLTDEGVEEIEEEVWSNISSEDQGSEASNDDKNEESYQESRSEDENSSDDEDKE